MSCAPDIFEELDHRFNGGIDVREGGRASACAAWCGVNAGPAPIVELVAA